MNAVPGRKCGHITTVEVFDGARRFSTGYTTPPLKQLREIFAAMEENGCTDCVMEVSSHALSQNRTGDTRFAGGAFTNLTEDHLDYHKTMEAYFAAKLELAKKVASVAETRPDMGRGDLPPFVGTWAAATCRRSWWRWTARARARCSTRRATSPST